jgi:membrane protein insertase Oxa1/YidC/SpoIIIJ
VFTTLIVQPIFNLLALIYALLPGHNCGLNKIIHDPHQMVSFAYPAIQHLSWMQALAHDIHRFDNTLFGLIDLSKPAIGKNGGGVYWPAMVLVVGSAIAQYFQSKQLLPTSKDQRGLRSILKEAGEGKQADQAEVNAAVGRSTIFLLPAMIFIFTVNLASALSLYWLTGGIVAYIQQYFILKTDESEMEEIADRPTKKNVKAIPEAEVVADSTTPSKRTKTKKKAPRNKRRK